FLRYLPSKSPDLTSYFNETSFLFSKILRVKEIKIETLLPPFRMMQHGESLVLRNYDYYRGVFRYRPIHQRD
ncbi:hypothetical protein MUP38_00020, partial [Candidatus Bathyarchaeota archaeon]|nr:hypothetical protein [Candidatus Bathyarchaeota archaeon]